MSARPRPVTATVTKPPWMKIPPADAAMYRRQSLTSNGSTASLTSVLDHDSYISEPEIELDKGNLRSDKPLLNGSGDAKTTFGVHFSEQPKPFRKVKRQTGEIVDESAYNLRRSNSSDSGLSAWEMWLVQKAKDERKQRKQEQQRKKQEKEERSLKEQEKQMKERKTEEVRQDWLQRKSAQEKLNKKMQKLKVQNEKRMKEEEEQRVRSKSNAVFSEWKQTKLREEKEQKRREKEKARREEEERMAKQEQAQQKYLEWLKRHKPSPRPKSAPQGGYNNNAPYPRPGYVNPVPWQHPAVPKVKQDKPKKSKPRRYVWNPAKYF